MTSAEHPPSGHRVAIYYAWSRPEETSAPLGVIDDRFPTLFESRRMLYPRLVELSDPSEFDQTVAGFLDHILKKNFRAFVQLASDQTGQQVIELERVAGDGVLRQLTGEFLSTVDTLIVISFDSLRTGQDIADSEMTAIRDFLAVPGNLLFVCPHHDIGRDRQEAEFFHHGDRTIPPRQGFGRFGRSLLAGLGLQIDNQFGLRPATEPDGSPSAIDIAHELDRSHILKGVTTFNAHPHLPHFARQGDAVTKMDVLARQYVDTTAPAHPAFTQATFDALLQTTPGVFAGDVLVGDATLWSSTAGGVESLERLWSNVVGRPAPSR
ncbi:hypothetical protein [Mycolicibacterium cosmeticum]|uniref:hypothetical protein n=1 Tax=Mycolicibacterium cosmeticum TaxID=258533 RepID=UPI003204776C